MLLHRLANLSVLLLFQASHAMATSSNNKNANSKPSAVLIVDVDNCLYQESLLRSTTSSPGVEEQIVKNLHTHCQEALGMLKETADELHHQYGATLEGVRYLEDWKDLDAKELQAKFQDCYDNIYNNIDYTSIFQLYHTSHQHGLTTGYSHADAHAAASQLKQVRALLEKLPVPLYLASNSPSGHAWKVLQSLGLMQVKWKGIATPDIPNSHPDHLFPTKHSPHIFYQHILSGCQEQKPLILLDDSQNNIKAAEQTNSMTGIQVTPDNPLLTALLQGTGVIDNSNNNNNNKYEFDQVKYLQTKNVVDAQSFHRPTWLKVGDEVRKLLDNNPPTKELQILDVGAGLLSMLKLILNGYTDKKNKDQAMPSLLEMIRDKTNTPLRYIAYEPNRELQAQCRRILTEELAFTTTSTTDQEEVFTNTLKGRPITVHVRFVDYNDDHNIPSSKDGNDDDDPIIITSLSPQLIVGCCFADLLDPHQLAPSLLRRFCSSSPQQSSKPQNDACLCYFPITFQGITQFLPPQPFESSSSSSAASTLSIPSDTVAFALYAQALEKTHGHNLNPRLFASAMAAYGATLLTQGASDWVIEFEKHDYLWLTLLYFFERVAGPELWKQGWDAPAWFARARASHPTIHVSNVDLLFRLPRLGSAFLPIVNEKNLESSIQQQDEGMEEIQFVAPHEVTTVTKQGVDLGPNQVQIKSEYSLISSGTELKIFKGMFDDAALDINIKGMDEERMAYPLAYGYSLVGRVVQCGSDVKDADDLLGKLVFVFAAHATHVIADRDSIQMVPEGIDAQDAIFMPSVETACSIIHDAHVRLGETVAVFGQGLIGLLVTAILSSTMQQSKMAIKAPACHAGDGPPLGTITAFDSFPSRLAASAAMGASQALFPQRVTESGPFDVAIEVSGNARALQAAIDNTRNHGRVIVGSWYGNADVTLKLGIDFHRSHKSLITSQVSEMRPELSGLWSKDRRFALTWELVRQVKPSRLITKKVPLHDAQEAYDALDKGTEIAVAFDYVASRRS